jgi:hypothetical protein
MNEQEALHISATRHAHAEIADFRAEKIFGKKITKEQRDSLTNIIWLAHYSSFIEGNLSNIEPVRGLQDDFN